MGGFVTLQFVAAAGFALLLFTVLANLVVFQYGRGVVRAALDEGARRGAREAGGTTACEASARQVLSDLLGGALGSDVQVRCADSPAHVRASARVRFAGWLPLVPDWSFSLSAVSVKRVPP